MLLFDNISRVHFHRKLKKVVKFLNEISEGEDSEYDAFEFFRYHSVGMNTCSVNFTPPLPRGEGGGSIFEKKKKKF